MNKEQGTRNFEQGTKNRKQTTDYLRALAPLWQRKIADWRMLIDDL
ncbi:hypothetical protein [Flavobacterium ammonificans]|nr:hypothetical protein [Flavobacterium ammonificans]